MSSLRLVPPTGRALEITQDRSGAVIGRSADADFTLEDGSVSRRHARLEWRGNAWYVVDLGSANGTFVGGQRIGESEIRPGQELRLGSVSLTAEAGEPEGSDATVAIPGLTAVMPAWREGREPEPETEALPPEQVPAPPGPAPPVFSPPPPPASPPPPPPASVPAFVPASAGGAAPVPQMAAPPAPPRGRSPLFWVAGGCLGCLTLAVLFVAAIGGGIWMATRGPVEDAREQLERMGSGDLDAAYAELAEAYRARLSREQFEALVAAHPALADYADSTFANRNVQNERARIGGSLQSTSGGVEPVVIELVRERGEWRITAIRFEMGDPDDPDLGGGGADPEL